MSDPLADPEPDTPDPAPAPTRWQDTEVSVPVRIIAIALAVAVFFGAARFVSGSSGYSRLGPGPVVEISTTVSGPVVDRGAASRPGSMSFTTVNVADVSRAGYWIARLTHRTEHLVFDPPSPLGTLTAKEQMEASRRQAGALALRLVTGDVPQADTQLVVAGVEPGSPASRAGLLRGDVIESVNDANVTGYDQLRTTLGESGGQVRLQVRRQSATLPLEATLEAGKLGVVLTEVLELKDGIDLLSAQVQGVGGPSAGLMLTLAFIDALSPGDLRAGRRLAGTGTIQLNGSVGAISGVRYKMSAAAQAGSEVFFVPTANHLADPPAGITVVAVDTVFDALQWLCTNGATDAVCTNPEVWS